MSRGNALVSNLQVVARRRICGAVGVVIASFLGSVPSCDCVSKLYLFTEKDLWHRASGMVHRGGKGWRLEGFWKQKKSKMR